MSQARQRSAAGFSLLEVVLAVAMLGIVVMSVSVTWNAALNGWRRTAGMADVFQRERVIMNAISDLSQSVVFYRVDGGLYDVIGAKNASLGDSISFVTASDAFLPPSAGNLGGLRRVTLTMAQDLYGRPYLGIRNRSALGPEEDDREPAAVLSAEVTGLQIRYWHPRQNAWQDKWEEKSLIPSIIEFTVTFADADSRSAGVSVTRQVELPTALYSMQTSGAAPSEGATSSSTRGRRRDSGGNDNPTINIEVPGR